MAEGAIHSLMTIYGYLSKIKYVSGILEILPLQYWMIFLMPSIHPVAKTSVSFLNDKQTFGNIF